MTNSSFTDLVKISTATTGTGTITLGSAVSGFRGSSALTDTKTYSYAIQDGANYEAGQGVYTASGTTLTRVVTVSSNSNTAISLSGSAIVLITVLSADFKTFGRFVLLGTLVSANFNSTADQAIAIAQPGSGSYVLAEALVTNASASLTTAKGAFYAAASKTTALFGGLTTTAYSSLTTATAAARLGQVSSGAGGTATIFRYSAATTIYLSLTTAQGTAATADIYIWGFDLS